MLTILQGIFYKEYKRSLNYKNAKVVKFSSAFVKFSSKLSIYHSLETHRNSKFVVVLLFAVGIRKVICTTIAYNCVCSLDFNERYLDIMMVNKRKIKKYDQVY